MTGVTQKICYRMRKEIAAKIAVVPMSYFNGHSKGDVLSRITNDVDTLGQSLNQSVTQLITSVTQIIGVLVMMLSISLPLTGVTVLTLPAAAIILTVMITSRSRTSASNSRFWAPSTALSRRTLPARTSFRCSTAPRPRLRSSTVKTTDSLLAAGVRSSCRA